MLSFRSRGCLVAAFAVLMISQAFSVCSAQINEVQWREASPTRVIIRSTADWGRVLFDDLNGTNSNGLRIKSVISSGWLEGEDSNDQLYAGRKIAWPDTEFDTVVARKGDMVAFFKGLNDFHYTEVYADLVLEVNIDLPRVYLWLMTGGNGTTSFEIVNKDNGGTLWRDIIVASGETQQVKRVMSPQPFFQPGRAESSVVVTWLTIGIAVMLVLNFPILESLLTLVRRITRSRAKAREGNNRGGDDRREEATEQK